jgi:hypothetical protein
MRALISVGSVLGGALLAVGVLLAALPVLCVAVVIALITLARTLFRGPESDARRRDFGTAA